MPKNVSRLNVNFVHSWSKKWKLCINCMRRVKAQCYISGKKEIEHTVHIEDNYFNLRR